MSNWLMERLPVHLTRLGPLGLLWWQWIILPMMAAAAWAMGVLLRRVTQGLLGRLVKHTAATWDDQLLARMSEPLTLGWSLIVGYVVCSWIDLQPKTLDAAHRLLGTGMLVALLWASLRAVTIASDAILLSAWARNYPAARSLVPLAARVTKVVVAVTAAVAVMAEFGLPVTTLVAGLGVGGLALALAAQKTVENLFGAFSLGVDQPFREGDFVKIEDFVGTVEAIGLRSTRIRTLDRTLISIPNGKLAEARLESYSARDRMRLACMIGLVYSTPVAMVRQVLAGLEVVLREHPKIWPETVVVRFKEFADSALNIEVMAWFSTADWGEFQLIRQEVLLRFMDVVEEAGSSFAFPTRSIHIAAEPPRAV